MSAADTMAPRLLFCALLALALLRSACSIDETAGQRKLRLMREQQAAPPRQPGDAEPTKADFEAAFGVPARSGNGQEPAVGKVVNDGGDSSDPAWGAPGKASKAYGQAASAERRNANQTPAQRALATTDLGKAALAGNLEHVKVCLAHGAQFNKVDKQGKGVMHYAAQMGKASVVAELLTWGADANLADRRGITPLMVAAAKGKATVVTALLKAPALKLDAQDRDGDSALFAATAAGHSEICDVLLSAGASVLVANKAGKTAVDASTTPEVAEYLRSWADEEREKRAKAAKRDDEL